MMRIVIELSEDTYKKLMQKSMLMSASAIDEAVDAVKNGMVLPNGHSDLIDRSQTLRTDCFGDGHDGLRAFHEYADYAKMRKYLQSLPIIVPADKEGA